MDIMIHDVYHDTDDTEDTDVQEDVTGYIQTSG